MTRKTWIVLAIIFLIPVVIIAVTVSKYNKRNPVVAEYADRVNVISYNGLTLHAVPGEDGYSFRYGEYLGKVSDSFYGASLYRVRDDATGKYYALADGDRNVLYTESGRLADGVYDFITPVTRIIIGNYRYVFDDSDTVTMFASLEYNERTAYEFIPSDCVDDAGNRTYEEYLIRVCYGGSAICTGNIGRLIYMTDSKKWIYLSPAAVKEVEEAEIAVKDPVYNGVSIENISSIRTLRTLFGKDAPSSTGEDTGASETKQP